MGRLVPMCHIMLRREKSLDLLPPAVAVPRQIFRLSSCRQCFVGFRSLRCAGHWSELNPLSRSRGCPVMVSALWHGRLCRWKHPLTVAASAPCSIMGKHVAFKYCTVGLEGGPKCLSENFSNTVTFPAQVCHQRRTHPHATIYCTSRIGGTKRLSRPQPSSTL